MPGMSPFMDHWTTAAALEVKKILDQAVAEERETCAKIAEKVAQDDGTVAALMVARKIAEGIRERRPNLHP